MKHKILITGSSGMVGQSLISFFRNKNLQILTPSSKKLNLLNPKIIEKFFKKEKPTYIIHLAGYVGGIGANINEPVNFFEINAMMGLNLISIARKHKIRNVLNIASSCIYPPNNKKPNQENDLLKGDIEKTNEAYAVAKIACVKFCEYISKNSKYNYFSLLPCNIYGPNDSFHSKKSHVVASLIKKIYHAKKNKNKSVEIWGSGNARREIIYVDDVASAISRFLFNRKLIEKNIYWLNIGTGYDLSIKLIAKKISKILDYRGKFLYNLKMPDGAKTKLMDSKISKSLGWEPKYSHEEGLNKTIKWYIDNVV
jgi:GDP-L-fucose synthase